MNEKTIIMKLNQTKFYKLFLKELLLPEIGTIFLIALSITFLFNLHLISFVVHLPIPSNFFNNMFSVSLLTMVYLVILIPFLFFYAIGITKVGCAIFYFLASNLSFFIYKYGTIYDEIIIKSTFETTSSEFAQYLNPILLAWMLFNTICILCFIFRVRFQNTTLTQRFKNFTKLISLVLLGILLIGLIFYKDYASFLRNNRQFRQSINPTSSIYETGKYLKNRLFPYKKVFVKIGLDAKIKRKHSSKKKLIVLILGETARSDHFSLNGYGANETTPNLKNLDVISLKQVTSCGTSTAVSVPCMFSNMGISLFSIKESGSRSNLLDIVQKSGYQVLWIDNNTGCQGVCDRVETVNTSPYKNTKNCPSDTCFDEILVSALKDKLDSNVDQFIVLHTLGSHGPSYYLRYPKEFSRFKPTCDTSELSNCSKEEVTNVYDNTILYTDYIVSEIIKNVDNISDEREKAVIYVSDHGESLGENGIYLHSLPYFIAPKEQKYVPFIFWFDQNMIFAKNNEISVLKRHSKCNFTHDNLFSTCLNILDITTDLYLKSDDLFKIDETRCKY